jgi:hypothetical protein
MVSLQCREADDRTGDGGRRVANACEVGPGVIEKVLSEERTAEAVEDQPHILCVGLFLPLLRQQLDRSHGVRQSLADEIIVTSGDGLDLPRVAALAI